MGEWVGEWVDGWVDGWVDLVAGGQTDPQQHETSPLY